MSDISEVVKRAKQPRGGFIKPSSMTKTDFDDGESIIQGSLHPTIQGLTADHLSRAFLPGVSLVRAFEKPVRGAFRGGFEAQIHKYLEEINGLDEISIIAASKLVTYARLCSSDIEIDYDPEVLSNPNQNDIKNIKILVNRTMEFYETYGPITQRDFTFIDREMSDITDIEEFKIILENSGFTKRISSGEGNYLTNDSIWIVRASKSLPNKNLTLDLLIQYLMGLKSNDKNGKPLYSGSLLNVKKLGIFNPLLNSSWVINIEDIPEEVIKEVEENIIGD